MSRRPIAISLFSGAGGMDVGVAQAGFNIKADVEIDPFCCETLRENIRRRRRGTKVFETDVRTLDPLRLLADCRLAPGEVDLLFGGPPCQAFSQIGKRKSLEDERGPLLFETTRFARAIEPRAIMVEQVKGLLKAKDLDGVSGGVFDAFLRELESLGYVPKLRVAVAADYGAPQKRERVIIVALKNAAFRFPEPTHCDFDRARLPEPLRSDMLTPIPYKTVGEALQGLPAPVVKGEGDVPDDSHYDVTPKRDRERIRGVPEGKYLASQTQLPQEQRKGLTRRDTTKFLRLDRSKPSNTLRGGEIFFHPTEDRYLTPREYMRLHGYPDDYVLRGPIRGRSGSYRNLDQHRQVGNSVPPPLARAIAESIREALE